jgi:hypothetical protein
LVVVGKIQLGGRASDCLKLTIAEYTVASVRKAIAKKGSIIGW